MGLAPAYREDTVLVTGETASPILDVAEVMLAAITSAKPIPLEKSWSLLLIAQKIPRPAFPAPSFLVVL